MAGEMQGEKGKVGGTQKLMGGGEAFRRNRPQFR